MSNFDVHIRTTKLNHMKIKLALVITLMGFLMNSCGTLKSTTTIDANNSFVLGNNQHAAFSVRLKNVSENDIDLHRAPIDGGRHSFETLKPGQTTKVNVEKNTALVIENKAGETGAVELFVVGDTGLSMGYKN
jgi:hypothetical protein